MLHDPSLQASHVDRQCGHEEPVNNTKETLHIQNQKLTVAGAIMNLNYGLYVLTKQSEDFSNNVTNIFVFVLLPS